MTRSNEGHAPQCVIAAQRRSIVVLGDDPLMVRALDRLLRTAGYSVGVGERTPDFPGARLLRPNRPDVELTIVDVPDDWSRTHGFGPAIGDLRDLPSGKVLWISAFPSPVNELDRCLVKPFTSSQLLDKVRTLLSQPLPL